MARKNITKEKIIEQAVIISNLEGFGNITLRKIAEALQIKPPSLFNHISGLDELKELLIEFSLEQFSVLLKDISSKEPIPEKVKEICDHYYTFSQENPGLYEALNDSSIISEKLSKKQLHIVLILIEKLNLPFKNEEKQIQAIRILRILLHGFVDLKRQDSFKLQEDITNTFNLIPDIFMLYLKNT